MQLKNKLSAKTHKKLEQFLRKENDFITDLFSKLPFPKSALNHDDQESEYLSQENQQQNEIQTGDKPRATSLVELQRRLDKISAMRNKQKLNYKQKLLKKNLKNRIKKKTKLDDRKLVRAAKLTEVNKTNIDESNKDNLVYSKIDFPNVKLNKNNKKQEKDPKKILETLQKKEERLKQLEESGEKEKVAIVKEKQAWKSAISKAEGLKVKDDPLLLKKSIKKQEQLKRKSKKKWEARQEGVKKAQEDRQRKRNENIAKKKKEKKVKKLKSLSKRGKIIPGF